jgi:RimJ/RimL family protein N-acetyltransferase
VCAELDRQPTLVGATLTVRPLRADDLDALHAVAGDPLLWDQHPNHDRWRREVFKPFFADTLASGGGMAVIDRGAGAIIGSSRFEPVDESRRAVEIGWTYLARSHWGGATNRELKQLMIDHAFASGVAIVHFAVAPENFRSRRAVEKLGAHKVGTKPHEPGPDWVLYALARDAWRG